MRIGGLDVSTACTGYCAPNGSLHSIRPTAGAGDPARRLSEISDRFERCIRLNPPLPDLIVMERYSLGFARKKADGRPASAPLSTATVLGEVGGVVKLAMFRLGIRFVVVPPKSIKLFATGRGNADKTLMRHTAESLVIAADAAAPLPANDDEADAWHLRRMGRVVFELDEVLADWERAAIDGCGVSW